MVRKTACLRAAHRQAVAVVIAIALILSLVPAIAFAEQETQSQGKIVITNKAPEILTLNLYESNRITPVTQMTPQTEYSLKVTVKDANKLNDLTQLKVTMFYDTNRNLLGTAPGTGNAQTAAIFTWTGSGGWALTSPTATTWTIVTGTGKSEAPANMNTVSGDFYLHFKPGKVAKETAGTDDWDFYAVATDQAAATGAMGTYGTLMLWYGELSANVDINISFGDIELGTTDQVIIKVNEQAANSFNLTPVANGNYKLNVKSGDWTKGGDTLAPGNDITLKVDDDTTVAGSETLNTSYAVIAGHSSEIGPTVEAGTSITIGLWVSLAAEGIPTGEYSGAIYFQIVND